MTYFGFLFTFLIPPILILLLVNNLDQRKGKRLPVELAATKPWTVILVLIGIALIYTTPWDNFLVATHVWWYDPELVSGITLGWVPLEEYIFFILQTALTGLLTITLARNLPKPEANIFTNNNLRAWSAGIILVLWLCAAGAFILNVDPAAYTSLLLLWALPPIALQLVFGADILWHNRKLTSLAIVLPTFYLAMADSLAIGLGTWTINPQQSFNLFIGALPIEELFFFFCTNTLIVFGIVLAISVQGITRFKSTLDLARGLRNPSTTIDQDFSSK
jgi:lycopene cyclase domain-containing protein